MKRLYIGCILLCCSLALLAQNELNERVYVHLDKDCYVAGEDMQIKFLVTDTEYQPSNFSKVGYVEVCDMEKPHIQLKVALNKGVGAAKMAIPFNTPSGVYQLTGYTRYMRNEGEQVFFKRQVAIVNMGGSSGNDRFKLVEDDEKYPLNLQTEQSTIRVSTDKQTYQNRSMVELSLNNLPADVTDLVVTVSRNDSITYVSPVNKSNWLRKVPVKTDIALPWRWMPEYEGHIITGYIEKRVKMETASSTPNISANLGFVGKDIRYVQGQQKDNQHFHFYTNDIYGPQEVVTTVAATDNSKYRMQLLSPFAEVLPDTLPDLYISAKDMKLMDRFVSVQLQQIMGVDSLGNKLPLDNYYYFRTPKVYDLDEYTRFPTLGETIIEFVRHITVRKGRLDRRVMRVLMLDGSRLSSGNTLVLLDGVPIADHEKMLKYNPLNIRTINIYDGLYLFGGEMYECMISFVSHRQNLSAIQLDDTSQLFPYDCPSLPELDKTQYNEHAKENLKPDFRHTLYWNPFVESIISGSSAGMSFYTSDLSGEYQVIVEGFTKDGKAIYGTTLFSVSP